MPQHAGSRALFVVGQSLVDTPSDNRSAFTESLGVALGSLVLGGLGVFVGGGLLASHSAECFTSSEGRE